MKELLEEPLTEPSQGFYGSYHATGFVKRGLTRFKKGFKAIRHYDEIKDCGAKTTTVYTRFLSDP